MSEKGSHQKIRLTAYAFLGLICMSLIMSAVSSFNVAPLIMRYDPPGFNRFRSEAELRWFLQVKTESSYQSGNGFRLFGMGATIMTQTVKEAPDAATGSSDYSSTNVQVAGVDEADIIKTDGTYLYIAKDRYVYVVRAYPPEKAELLSKITLDREVSDLYIAGDKLVVFTRGYGRFVVPQSSVSSSKMPPPMPYIDTTTIRIYNVADRDDPVQEREFDAEGGYLSSRMIGDYVYVVTQKGIWLYEGVLELPAYKDNGKTYVVPATEIYYYNGTDPWYSFTTVTSLNTQDPKEPVRSETFLLGSGSTVYCSLKNLYLTTGGYGSTGVHKISLDNGEIDTVAEGTVPGWILNQFSMDENKGYFRIATTSGRVSRSGGGSSNNVYVLDSSMKVIGTLEDLAPGESIYSARFMGDRCYLVTFKKVDPLFVIDLKDPTSPKVLGKLKIPGYSNYLHPYDENHIIGVGKETVEAEGGNFAWYQGLKISLFDVTDVSNPRELAKIEIGDRGTDSPALQDHKAFLFSRDKNLLVIPILEAKIDMAGYAGKPPANAYGDFVYQGAYVFRIDLEGINLKGRVTHLTGDELMKSGYWFQSEYSVERSLYIGENLYTVSGKMVKINSLSSLSELKVVELK